MCILNYPNDGKKNQKECLMQIFHVIENNMKLNNLFILETVFLSDHTEGVPCAWELSLKFSKCT